MFLPGGGCSLPLWDALALHILPPCIPYPLGYPTHKKGHETRDTPPPTTKAAGTHPTWMLSCYVIAIAITIRLKNGLCTHYYNCDCKSYSIHRKESQSQHCRIKGTTRLIPYSLCRKFRQLILPFMNRSINFYRSQMKLRLRGRFYFTPICQSFYSQGEGCSSVWCHFLSCCLVPCSFQRGSLSLVPFPFQGVQRSFLGVSLFRRSPWLRPPLDRDPPGQRPPW